jgi:hypothetical protein
MTTENNICRPATYSEWYERVYPQLSGYGLWLKGGELNTIPAREFETRPFRILIGRLSTCFDTAESFSHKVLYQIARRQKKTYPDLAYLPPAHDAPVFARDTIPWLLGTQTKRGPRDFDVIAFSNAIVQELVNVPVMLEKSGIALRKSERLGDPGAPLVILGGSNALYTSVFFTPDPPVDGIFFGESTDCVSRLFGIMSEAKEQGLSKQETLTRCETVPGFVQPDRPVPTKRVYDMPPGLNGLLEDAPSFYAGEQPGRGNLQLSEGCPAFCSFCSESFCRKPYREADAEDIVRSAARMKSGMGLDKMELYSFNFNTHSHLLRIIEGLSGLFPIIGLKSQRFDAIAQDPGLLPCLHAIGKTSLTCGLEGISPRLRRYLQKSLSEADLAESIARILSSPVRECKLFLIATGKEEDQDFACFADLLDELVERAERSPATPRIIFSLTPLVRFPWTPLEFEDAPHPRLLKPIIFKIKDLVERHGFEFRLSSDLNDYLLSQVLVRAADPRLFECLLSAVRAAGYVYYRTVPASFVTAFLASCAASGIAPDECLAGSGIDTTDKPWSRIETGVGREFLLRQHAAAQAFSDNAGCLGRAGQKGSCKACGACDDAARESIIAPRYKTSSLCTPLKEKVKTLRSSTETLSLLVAVDDSRRGLPRAAIGAALGRALMKTSPDCVTFYRGYCRSFLSGNVAQCWLTGDDILTLQWLAGGMETIRDLLADPADLSRINSLFAGWGRLKRIMRDEPDRYTISLQSPYQFSPKKYFSNRPLSYVLRKNNEAGYSFEFTRQALKKNILFGLSYKALQNGETDMVLTAGSKFDYEEFARESFTIGTACDWVRIRMTAVI